MTRIAALLLALTTAAVTGCIPTLDGNLDPEVVDEPRGMLIVSAEPVDAFTCVPDCGPVGTDIILAVEGEHPVAMGDLLVELDAGLDAWWLEHDDPAELLPGDEIIVTAWFEPTQEGTSMARLVIEADAEFEVDAWTRQGAAEITMVGESIYEDVGCRGEGRCD